MSGQRRQKRGRRRQRRELDDDSEGDRVSVMLDAHVAAIGRQIAGMVERLAARDWRHNDMVTRQGQQQQTRSLPPPLTTLHNAYASDRVVHHPRQR
jgi:hypothetical protein